MRFQDLVLLLVIEVAVPQGVAMENQVTATVTISVQSLETAVQMQS